MKPKLITYDIDGTLVPEYGDCVPAENREAILRAKRAGCMICPSSGRTHSNLRKLLGDLVEDTCSVTMNGRSSAAAEVSPALLHLRRSNRQDPVAAGISEGPAEKTARKSGFYMFLIWFFISFPTVSASMPKLLMRTKSCPYTIAAAGRSSSSPVKIQMTEIPSALARRTS